MAELVELNKEKHRNLRVTTDCTSRFAETQHVLNIRAGEVGKAVSSFPVFFSRNPSSGTWMLSAVTSLEAGSNLFVDGDEWTATYRPTLLETYPLFLMRSPHDETSYCIGIDETSSAFSYETGEAIFDENGEESLHLTRVKALLEANFENDIQTHLFSQRLEELGLFKSVNINVYYKTGDVQTITSLHTIDEDKLKALKPEELHELETKGYLLTAHAILVSIFQMNLLVRKHNQVEGNTAVIHVKLEVARDPGSSEAGF